MFELFDYWRDFPPVHEVVKIAYGVERKEKGAPEISGAPRPADNDVATTGEISGLLNSVPNGCAL